MPLNTTDLSKQGNGKWAQKERQDSVVILFLYYGK